MDLDKAKTLVLSSKRAIFYPGSGSPLSGRYIWKEGEYILYLAYDGQKDQINDFQTSTLLNFEEPWFEGLMQKHLISYKRLPDNLLQRVRQLREVQAENMYLMQRKGYIFPLEEQKFLFYRSLTGFACLDATQDWRLDLEEASGFAQLSHLLWKNPALKAIAPNSKILFYLNDYLKNLEKYLNALHHANFGLIKEDEVIFHLEGRYLWVNLNTQGRIPREVLNQPEDYVISAQTLLEYIWDSHYKRQGNNYPYFHLKKLPQNITRALPMLGSEVWEVARA